MLEEKAGLDTVDVEFSPPEVLELADREEEKSDAELNAGKEEKGEEKEEKPAEESELTKAKPTRFEARIAQLAKQRAEAEEKSAAAEAALELTKKRLEELEAKGRVSADDPLDTHIEKLRKRVEEETDDPSMTAMLEAQLALLERDKERNAKKAESEPPLTTPPPQQHAGPHPAAQKWLDQSAWYTETDDYERPAHPGLKTIAEGEYAALLKRYGSDSEELFNELDERLKGFPEFERVLGAGQKNGPPARPSRQNTSPPNAHGDSGTRSRVDGDGMPVLDENDRAQIQKWNMDPNDPEVRKTYMKYNPRKFARGTQQ